MSVNHWILRIGPKTEHFEGSTPLHIWGVKSHYRPAKGFLNKAKEGDRLWFITSKNKKDPSTQNRLFAVATYHHQAPRVLGPLLAVTATSEELGWVKNGDDWDTEIHYTNLFRIECCGLYLKLPRIMPCVVFPVKPEYELDLDAEYSTIIRYSASVIVPAPSKAPTSF